MFRRSCCVLRRFRGDWSFWLLSLRSLSRIEAGTPGVANASDGACAACDLALTARSWFSSARSRMAVVLSIDCTGGISSERATTSCGTSSIVSRMTGVEIGKVASSMSLSESCLFVSCGSAWAVAVTALEASSVALSGVLPISMRMGEYLMLQRKNDASKNDTEWPMVSAEAQSVN